jgi:hypothetical protein
MKISASVGRKGANKNNDLVAIQVLLNMHIVFDYRLKEMQPIITSGTRNLENTIAGIIAFQTLVMGINNETVGRIEPKDDTFKALTGNVFGMPEVHLDIETRLNYKLKLAFYSDELEYMDLDGNTTRLVNILLDPNGDDDYFPKKISGKLIQSLEYIENAPHDRPPPPPGDVAASLKKYVGRKFASKHTTRDFIEFLQQDVRLEVESGLEQFRLTDEETRQMIDSTRTIGPGIAYRELMMWFINQKLNKNSIYSCVATDIDVTK